MSLVNVPTLFVVFSSVWWGSEASRSAVSSGDGAGTGGSTPLRGVPPAPASLRQKVQQASVPGKPGRQICDQVAGSSLRPEKVHENAHS